jgi:tetratricopeptide (TPR) repeat protein
MPGFFWPTYYFSTGRRQDARATLEQFAAQLPAKNAENKLASSQGRLRLASLEFADKRTAQAYKLVDEMLSQDPKDVPAMVLKARFMLAEAKVDLAITQLKAALVANPKFAEAHYYLGDAYRAQGRLSEATMAFAEVLRLAEVRRFSCRTNAQGKSKAAVEFAQQALKEQPGTLLPISCGSMRCWPMEMCPGPRRRPGCRSATAQVLNPTSPGGDLSRQGQFRAAAGESKALNWLRLSRSPERFDQRHSAGKADEARAAVRPARQDAKHPALLLLAAKTFVATHDDRGGAALRQPWPLTLRIAGEPPVACLRVSSEDSMTPQASSDAITEGSKNIDVQAKR